MFVKIILRDFVNMFRTSLGLFFQKEKKEEKGVSLLQLEYITFDTVLYKHIHTHTYTYTYIYTRGCSAYLALVCRRCPILICFSSDGSMDALDVFSLFSGLGQLHRPLFLSWVTAMGGFCVLLLKYFLAPLEDKI